MRRQVAGRLVHEQHRAQLLRARLGPRPGPQLAEQQGEEEPALLVAQVGQADHVDPRPPARVHGFGEHRRHVQGLPLGPRGEAGSSQHTVEGHGQVHPVVGGEEPIEGEDAHLREGRIHELQDDLLDPRILADRPGLVEDLRQDDVRRIADRIALAAHQPQEPGHAGADHARAGVGVGRRRTRGGAEGPDHVDGQARPAARRKHAQRQPVGEGRHLGSIDAPAAESGLPALGHRRRLLPLDPRREVVGRELGEQQPQVAQVPLGIHGDHRDAGARQLLEQHQAQAGLAAPGHAHHHRVGAQA